MFRLGKWLFLLLAVGSFLLFGQLRLTWSQTPAHALSLQAHLQLRIPAPVMHELGLGASDMRPSPNVQGTAQSILQTALLEGFGERSMVTSSPLKTADSDRAAKKLTMLSVFSTIDGHDPN